MKHTLLTASVSLCGIFTCSAWNVSTQPTAQSALIEEFTGIHCPNCPDGHKIATELMNMHPEEVYTIAIHAGSFSKPSKNEPDFTVPLGVAIHDNFKVTGYPSGMVNRTDYGNRIVSDRAKWGAGCRTAIATQSPVNLWTEASYNASSRTLTLNVEGYFTADMQAPLLNVFLLQNEILGPQSGGLKGDEYPHRHALRGRLTDNDFGDPIEQKAKGEYFKRTFSYTLPETIGEIAVEPRNIELLTFVTEGEGSVCKVSRALPSIEGLVPLFNISTSTPPIAIGKNYAFDFIEVCLNNHGGVDLTDAEFIISMDNSQQTAKWEGLVPAHTNMTVRVPLEGAWDNCLDSESNQYSIRLVKANGIEVETSSIRGTFMEVATYPDQVTLKLMTDMNGSDNTWRILDREGNVVKEFGPYPDNLTHEYVENVQLENGKVYCLEVTDCWGDGLRNPSGSVKVLNASGKQIEQFKDITGYGFRQFFRTDSTLGVDSVVTDEIVKVEYFDLTGCRVDSPVSGLYIMRTTMADGSVSARKTMISANPEN